MDKDLPLPSEFEHQVVTTESGECSCGATHETGHAVWGGKVKPSTVDAFSMVEDLHSLDTEYRKV